MKFILTIPDSKDHVAMALALQALVEGVAQVNQVIMRHDNLPPLYESGVQFRAEDSRLPYDEIPDYLTMIERGYGDCAPLCAARIAELREQGVRATAKIYWRPERKPLPFHCEVRLPNGSVEDPSRRLGMVGKLHE